MSVYSQSQASATSKTAPFAAGSYPPELYRESSALGQPLYLGQMAENATESTSIAAPKRQTKYLIAAGIAFALGIGVIVVSNFSGKRNTRGISGIKPLKLSRALPAR